MAASAIPKHFTDGQITLADGNGTPVTLTVPLSTGDLSISGLGKDPKARATNVYEARGAITGLRRGAREYPTVSFSAQLADVSDATDQTVIDFLLKRGSYASNTSTSVAAGDVYTVKITLTIEGTDLGDSADHTIVMNDVDVRLAIAEGEPSTVTVEGTIYGNVTFT